MILFAAAVAFAGPQHVEAVHARKEARTIELLQRATTRPDVAEQAVARYLDRWGEVDIAAVERIEAWGASLHATDVPGAQWPAVETELLPGVPLAIPVPSP